MKLWFWTIYNFKRVHYQLLKSCRSVLKMYVSCYSRCLFGRRWFHSNFTDITPDSCIYFCLYLSVVWETNQRMQLWNETPNEVFESTNKTKTLKSHHCSSLAQKVYIFFLSANSTLMLTDCFLSLSHSFTPFSHLLSCFPPCFLFLRAFFFILQPDLYLDFLVWSCHNAPRCQHL